MKTEHLEYFLEVVQCRSINQASKKMHLNHQYLSQILTALENELGVKLLERTRVGIELTEEGRLAVTKIEAIVGELHELTDLLQKRQIAVNQRIQGTYAIYCASSIEPGNVYQAAQELQAVFPKIDLIFKECGSAETIKSVWKQENAIGQIVYSEQIGEKQPEVPEELELIVLMESQLVAWVDKDSSLLKKYDSITLKSILKYPVILYAPTSKEAAPAYKILSCAAQGEPPIKCITNNLTTFYKMLSNENSITIGVRQNVSSSNKRVAMIPIRDNIKIITALVVNKKHMEKPFVKAFIQRCRELYTH